MGIIRLLICTVLLGVAGVALDWTFHSLGLLIAVFALGFMFLACFDALIDAVNKR